MTDSNGDSRIVSFGEKVKSFRKAKGLSQADLATLARVDRKTINRLEAGHYSVSLRNMLSVADGLGVDPKELLD